MSAEFQQPVPNGAPLSPEQSVQLAAISAPAAAQSWTWVGNWAANQKRFNGAAAAFRRAQLIDPSDPLALRKAIAMLARVPDHKAIVELLRREDRDRSLPTNLLRALSNSEVELGRLEDALATLTAATDRHPDDPILHDALADRLISMHRPAEAEAALRTAIRLPGSNEAPFLKLAELVAESRPEEAINLLRDAANRYPASITVLQRLGTALQVRDRFSEAEQALRAAVGLPDAGPDLTLQLADVLETAGRSDDALDTLIEAGANHPGHIGIRHRLAEALVGSARLDDAERELRSTLALPGANALTHLTLAKILSDRGDPAGALGVLDVARDLYPADPDIPRLRAITLIALDRLDDADAELQSASNRFRRRQALATVFQVGRRNLDVLKRCRALGSASTAFVTHTEHAVFSAMCSSKGFYHNFQLHDGTLLFDRYGKMTNSPRADRPFNFVEWDIIKRHVVESGARHIADVGAADGYFSVQCAQLGCQVDAYEPSEMFHARTQLFAAYYGVADRVTASNASFAPHTQRRKRYDLILALGVIYHFNGLIRGLRDLTQSSDRLIIETTGSDVPGFNDYAATQFRDHRELSLTWLISFLERQGFDVHYVDEWNDYIKRTNVTPERHMLVCRRRTQPS
ncbi:tetratricopeptide repeat protein [Thalassobaculum sp.]|uniref:tetratricopeptide repeat protein n=1 Tax=Thalassobaculum sp. TaxID=2022740 RepID=UPI0032EBD054